MSMISILQITQVLFSSVRQKDLRDYHKINLDIGNNQRRCLIRIFQIYYSLTEAKYFLSC